MNRASFITGKKNFLKKFLIQSKYKKTRRILRVIDRDKHKL
jgi:hypothetical protein